MPPSKSAYAQRCEVVVHGIRCPNAHRMHGLCAKHYDPVLIEPGRSRSECKTPGCYALASDFSDLCASCKAAWRRRRALKLRCADCEDAPKRCRRCYVRFLRELPLVERRWLHANLTWTPVLQALEEAGLGD